MLVVTLFACGTTTAGEETTTTTTERQPQQLVVGVPEMNGEFISGFGNSSYDNYVRSLIYGYATYAVTPAGEIVINDTVVSNLATSTDDDGNKTYTFTIYDDLYWSDGVQITAEDFVFSVLFTASADWREVGGADTTSGEGLLGYSAYNDPEGSTSEGIYFEGVKLIDEYTFSLTIDAAELPYFYETAYVSYGPMPMHELAMGSCYIDSDETGSTLYYGFLKIANIVDVDGYRYYPTVTAGPYKFVSFVNQVVTLELDPLFKGDYKGDNATIDSVIIKRVNQTLDVDLVISGEIDLVTGVIEGSKIEAAEAAATAETNYYNRNGYGLLAMTCDFGPTQDEKVRQAIAYITDRQYVVDQVLGGYGSIVYSEYGLAQWMYQDSEEWVEDNLNTYDFSISAANALLDQTEWKYESDGTTLWDATKATSDNAYYRYNASGDRLVIKHFGTENNTVTTSLRDKFMVNMPLIGAEYTITIGTFDTLLDHYYFGFDLGEDRTYCLFNLATNFGTTYDPYYSWHSDFLNTWINSQGMDNEDLDALIVAMRETEPGDNETYLGLWRQYQALWNELIPNVPLYSNQYYDVYDSNLHGVETTPFFDWTQAIYTMYFGD
ncbi:MAG TPA: ABC transporter substrate-binding protein [Bacillota bacterium]|nr:ABC transporter substrate-binding protein [Bacillota bacterium]